MPVVDRSAAQPLISVAMPVKNGMPHLVHAIESLTHQTYQNFELIVQDGGSTDGSVEYIQSVKELPRVEIVSAPDRNVAEGFSHAYMRCRGDFVHSFACDEFLEPDALETCLTAYEKTPAAVFIYGNANFVDADRNPAGQFVAPVFDL